MSELEPTQEQIDAYKQRQEEKASCYADLASKKSAESKSTYELAHRLGDVIPFGQPILVGHYSEKADRRFRDRIWNMWGKSIELKETADYYAAKAERTANPYAISSDDPEAITKLKEKLVGLEKLREAIKAREHQSWELSNLSQNIRQVKQRIDDIVATRNLPEIDQEIGGIRLFTDKELNRVQLFFPGKPKQEVIDKLKTSGFHWTPSIRAWQRQISQYAIQRAMEIADSAMDSETT